MFRLIKTPLLLLIAFLAGLMFERSQQNELCIKSGGQWMRAGFCATKVTQ